VIGCRRFTLEEERALFAALLEGRHGPRNTALFALGIDTGFRIGELLSVRIKDLVLRGDIVDELCIQSKAMKNHKPGRKADLFKRTEELITEGLIYLQQRGFMCAEDLFFQSKTQRNQAIACSRAWEIIHNTARGLGMTGPIGTHSMRKTYAHKLYAYCKEQEARGVTLDAISVVQDALQHSSRKTTELYLDLKTTNIKWLIRGAMTESC